MYKNTLDRDLTLIRAPALDIIVVESLSHDYPPTHRNNCRVPARTSKIRCNINFLNNTQCNVVPRVLVPSLTLIALK